MPELVKLDPKAKAIWVEALRSGKYPQGRGALKTDDGYCCLGVACEVMGAKRIREQDGGNIMYIDRGGCGHSGCRWEQLPIGTAMKLGISEDNYNNGRIYVRMNAGMRADQRLEPCISLSDEPVSLDLLNDRGFSFEEIADIIEEQL